MGQGEYWNKKVILVTGGSSGIERDRDILLPREIPDDDLLHTRREEMPVGDEEISEVAIKIMDVAIKRLTERGFNVTQASGAKV